MAKSSKVIRQHYVPRIEQYAHSYQIQDWESREAQETRFSVLLDQCCVDGTRLLDIGCGVGDLLGYIRNAGLSCDYTGIDLLGEMVELARSRYPDGKFIQGDMFDQHIFPPGSFDIVYTSGIFNLDLGNNAAFLRKALARMFEVSRDRVVFNMLHARSTEKEAPYVYHDPQEISALMEEYGCRPVIIDSYLGNDFTVVSCVSARPPTAAGP